MSNYVAQWYWDTDWKGRRYKAFYHGPKLDWMKEFKNDTTTRNKKRQSTNAPTRKIS